MESAQWLNEAKPVSVRSISIRLMFPFCVHALFITASKIKEGSRKPHRLTCMVNLIAPQTPTLACSLLCLQKLYIFIGFCHKEIRLAHIHQIVISIWTL